MDELYHQRQARLAGTVQQRTAQMNTAFSQAQFAEHQSAECNAKDGKCAVSGFPHWPPKWMYPDTSKKTPEVVGSNRRFDDMQSPFLGSSDMPPNPIDQYNCSGAPPDGVKAPWEQGASDLGFANPFADTSARAGVHGRDTVSIPTESAYASSAAPNSQIAGDPHDMKRRMRSTFKDGMQTEAGLQNEGDIQRNMRKNNNSAKKRRSGDTEPVSSGGSQKKKRGAAGAATEGGNDTTDERHAKNSQKCKMVNNTQPCGYQALEFFPCLGHSLVDSVDDFKRWDDLPEEGFFAKANHALGTGDRYIYWLILIGIFILFIIIIVAIVKANRATKIVSKGPSSYTKNNK